MSPSVFHHYSGPSAEGTLQQGLDDLARTLQELGRHKSELSQSPAEAPFPQPDLNGLGLDSSRASGLESSRLQPQPGLVPSPAQPLQATATRNDDPDPQRPGLETQVVAQTAAVLEKAYGQSGSYQAQHYRITTIKPREGPARYAIYDRDDRRILSFERDGGNISIRDDQLSSAHKADFLAAAQTVNQQGLPETTEQASEVLGAMGPAQNRAEYQTRVNHAAQKHQSTDAFASPVKPTPHQAHQQEQAKTPDIAPVTAHDLAEWRMASVTLGRSAAQIKGIEAHGQTAAQLAGSANFNQLYEQDNQAPLAIQLAPHQRRAMDQDLAQFRDLVRERGPGFVQTLYDQQSRAAAPTAITQNSQLRPTVASHASPTPRRASGPER